MHFLVTIALPAELRGLARRHQKTLYNLLFRSSAEALQELVLESAKYRGEPLSGTMRCATLWV